MADIKTEKQLVAVLNDPQPSNINLVCGPGAVGFIVKNEGVTHTCMLTPDEAVKVGVSLIQLAGQAHAMANIPKGMGKGGMVPPGIIRQ